MIIYPAVLTDNLETAQKQLELANKLKVSGVQLDVIDGFYADNLTLTPADCIQLDFGKLSVDFHLMVDEPMDYLHELIEFKQQIPARAVIGQVEKMTYQKDFVQEAKRYGFLAGLSLDLFTPFEQIETEIFEELDILQIMGVRAGFQNQAFNPQALDLVRQAVRFKASAGHNLAVIVDGGVKLDNISQIKQAGADAVVVGSQLWQSEDIKSTFQALVKA